MPGLMEASISFDWSLLVFFLLMVVTGTSGAFFQPGEWYRGLRKPGWTPPNWLFGPVWTALYVMIAIAGWLVWRNAPAGAAIWLWGLQLAVNFCWSALFFGARRMDLAFYDVVLLWLLIAAFIVAAAPISLTAAVLFVPYLIWVTIAGTLNWTVWRMNPSKA
ncbi:TspO/MBR family protein [Mesorhizobium loti]|nr:TspO/MBR family protein [Mesorhizobium loti]